jgi:TonB family protein
MITIKLHAGTRHSLLLRSSQPSSLAAVRRCVCEPRQNSTPKLLVDKFLRLASLLVDGMPARIPHAIGIFDAPLLKGELCDLPKKPAKPSSLRRFTTIAACAMLCAGICATTLALSIHVDALAAGDDQHPSKAAGGPVAVKAEIIVNQIAHAVPPVYPVDAKKARIQGKVQLDAVIGKTGEVEQLKVVSGPKELQQSALDAVRQWTYKPFLLNGAPVEVETTISVIYSLGGLK